MSAADLNAELEDWSRWLAKQTLAAITKLDADKIRPFQPRTAEELEAAYQAWKRKHDPDPKARVARQKRAIASVTKRFPAFAKHVRKVWALPVPRTLIAVQAHAWRSSSVGACTGKAVRSASPRAAPSS